MMVDNAFHYKGMLRRDGEDGVEGTFVDQHGFQMLLTGKKVPGGYRCVVRGGEIPDKYLVPHD